MNSIVNDSFTPSDGTENITKDQFYKTDMKMRIKLHFIDAMLIPLILLGSFYFVSYVGAMAAFYPQKLISSFMNRPQTPTAERIVLAKQALK